MAGNIEFFEIIVDSDGKWSWCLGFESTGTGFRKCDDETIGDIANRHCGHNIVFYDKAEFPIMDEESFQDF
jgi:hypothetical protein